MRILDLYIGRTVIAGTLLALFILLAVDVFFSFANEIQDLGKGRYTLGDVFTFVGLTIPRRVYEMFPMAALIGSLLSLGTLASSSELVAIRAAGVSVTRISLSVLKAGGILLVIAAAIGEWVAPWSEQIAQQRRATAQSEAITFRSDHGLWARDGNRFINIKLILPDGHLSGIEVYEFSEDGSLKSSISAKTAEHVESGWRLHGARQGTLKDNVLTLNKAKRLDIPTLLSPKLLNVVTLAPEDLSARDLHQYANYMRDNGLDASRYDLAFWQRVFSPVSGLVMLFLSIPFVFGPLRSAGTGQRLLWGVMTGVAFYLVNQTMTHAGQVYGLPAPLSALLPALLFFAGGLWVMRQVR